MKYSYSTQSKAILRTFPQTAQYFVAVHNPTIIATGTLVSVPTTYPANSLSINNVVTGGNLNKIKRGMTLWAGQEGARYDRGQ